LNLWNDSEGNCVSGKKRHLMLAIFHAQALSFLTEKYKKKTEKTPLPFL